MSEAEIEELREVLEIAFDLLTDEQWAEYQRQRRDKFIQRANAKKIAA